LIQGKYELHEFFEGEDAYIEGNCLEENADGLLKFVVHDDEKTIEGPC